MSARDKVAASFEMDAARVTAAQLMGARQRGTQARLGQEKLSRPPLTKDVQIYLHRLLLYMTLWWSRGTLSYCCLYPIVCSL